MTVDDLIILIDKNSIENKKYSYLLEAINDWPKEVNTVYEYYSEIKVFLKINEITKNSIKIALRKRKPDFTKGDAWYFESISGLILFLKN